MTDKETIRTSKLLSPEPKVTRLKLQDEIEPPHVVSYDFKV